MITLPKLYNYTMPHPLDRTGQQEAFEAVAKWYAESDKQYMILSAPTGLGKTGILAQMSSHARVMALARTKVLLDSVYAGDYDFDQLQGKGNHPCRISPITHRADVCALPDTISTDDRHEQCTDSGLCSYYVELDKFRRSHKAVTTYAKYVSDRNLQSYNSPDLYAFDEAHEVPEAVIERAGINMNTSNTKKYPYLDGFPGLTDDEDMPFEDGIKVMRALYSTAAKNRPVQRKLQSEMTVKEEIEFKRQVMRHTQFLKRIEESGKMMVKSNDEGINIWHYSSSYSGDFSARPMSAEYHFKQIFGTGDRKTLLMSATITPLIANQLGIDPNDFEFHEAPQQYPVYMRKIWDLGLPSMGKMATDKNPALRVMQAQRISDILKLRPDVSSVILTSSKVKANRLTAMLRQYGHDVFTPPIALGTDKQLKAWEKYRKPGATCVSYNFWEGVSLDLDSMLFIADFKYPDLGTPFERARADRSWEVFYYRGAVYVAQGSGRIQRGHLRDYLPVGGPGNMVGKMVFLAAGNYSRIAKLAPGDFAQRITPWPW